MTPPIGLLRIGSCVDHSRSLIVQSYGWYQGLLYAFRGSFWTLPITMLRFVRCPVCFRCGWMASSLLEYAVVTMLYCVRGITLTVWFHLFDDFWGVWYVLVSWTVRRAGRESSQLFVFDKALHSSVYVSVFLDRIC